MSSLTGLPLYSGLCPNYYIKASSFLPFYSPSFISSFLPDTAPPPSLDTLALIGPPRSALRHFIPPVGVRAHASPAHF